MTTSTLFTTDAQVTAVLHILASKGGWVKARYLRAYLGHSKRRISALVNRANGEILAGNKGYKLTKLANREELHECLAKQRALADSVVCRVHATEELWQRRQRSLLLRR